MNALSVRTTDYTSHHTLPPCHPKPLHSLHRRHTFRICRTCRTRRRDYPKVSSALVDSRARVESSAKLQQTHRMQPLADVVGPVATKPDHQPEGVEDRAQQHLLALLVEGTPAVVAEQEQGLRRRVGRPLATPPNLLIHRALEAAVVPPYKDILVVLPSGSLGHQAEVAEEGEEVAAMRQMIEDAVAVVDEAVAAGTSRTELA